MGTEKSKKMTAKALEKIARNVAVGAGGDPTHWAFYEFEIPEAVKAEVMKKRERKAK